MSDKTRVVVISPSELLCAGLKSLLARSEFSVDECLSSVPDALEAGLVFIDPSVSGYGALFSRSVPVVALIHAAYDDDTLKHFNAVVSIYDSPQAILRKLRKIVSNTSGESEAQGDGGELSPREKEILVCVAQGMLNKEIAYKYNISIFTVMTHRKNITAKTGIKSIAGLTAYAILQGLIDISSIN